MSKGKLFFKKIGINSALEKPFIYIFSILISTAIILVLSLDEWKNKEIKRDQVEIEQSRALMIDKSLDEIYKKLYNSVGDGKSAHLEREPYLTQIEFLKTQRREVEKNIEDLKKNTDTQRFTFTLIASTLTIVIITFFSSSFFKSNANTKELLEKSLLLKKKIKEREAFFNKVLSEKLTEADISDLEIEKLNLLKSVRDNSVDYNEALDSNYSNKDNSFHNKFSSVLVIFEEAQRRIKDECSRLNKQALINLFLCFFIAFILMAIIAYGSIFSTELNASETLEIFLMKYLPKMIAVLGLLTMFLYFARLYKTNIIDVKYYQNELTNIEIMQIAWQSALISEENEVSNKILLDFSTIDRNRIINKEQSSIEIERLKIDNELNKNFLHKAFEILNISKKNDL